jgi:hypothetical protein
MAKTVSSGYLFRRVAGTAMLAGACALLAGPVAAQTASPVVLLLDQDAIAPEKPPNSFLPTGVNATIAAVGVRDFLPLFDGKAGQSLVLPGGEVGHEGWFALKSTPVTWNSSLLSRDGLQNFILASAGLGSPDQNGDRRSLLDGVSNVTPLRAAGLLMVIGQRVCALVYSGDIPWTATTTTSLQGANLGLVAFTVVSLIGGNALTLPSVVVRLLDPTSTCSEPLTAFVNAPNPT